MDRPPEAFSAALSRVLRLEPMPALFLASARVGVEQLKALPQLRALIQLSAEGSVGLDLSLPLGVPALKAAIVGDELSMNVALRRSHYRSHRVQELFAQWTRTDLSVADLLQLLLGRFPGSDLERQLVDPPSSDRSGDLVFTASIKRAPIQARLRGGRLHRLRLYSAGRDVRLAGGSSRTPLLTINYRDWGLVDGYLLPRRIVLGTDRFDVGIELDDERADVPADPSLFRPIAPGSNRVIDLDRRLASASLRSEDPPPRRG